jgi:phosphotransferase system enzyme I (PtsI)
MRRLEGIPVSSGVAIGETLVIDHEGFRIPRHKVVRDVVQDELQRLDTAIAAVSADIERNRDSISSQLGERIGAIFSAHLQMLKDPQLYSKLQGLVRDKHFTPEYAVSFTLRRYAKVFEDSENAYLRERAHDIYDLERSLLRSLLGHRREELAHLTSPVVVLAHNLTPSETANMNPEFVKGFVTEIGGASGHTAIVAKGLEIPAVVGTGKFLTDVSGGDTVIVDGDHGLVIIRPNRETIEHYQQEVERRKTMLARLESLRDLPAETKDGVRIRLMANIEFPREADSCVGRGADGIGLYRTEFLYLESETAPTEEDHFQAYAKVIHSMKGLPVVIRTLDLGADKIGGTVEPDEAKNPFLGLRSIRLALRNPELFMLQLRAILRASALGDVRVMFPLVTTLGELRQAKQVLAEAMARLRQEGLDFNAEIPVGMMVESPAAAVLADKFVDEIDFISIGTNDLIQYALAVDRTNTTVADLYQATDPAVLRLIDMSLQAARRGGIQASLCGQMSAEPVYVPLLLGLGLRELSVPSSIVPELKHVCRNVTIAQCEQIAHRAMSLDGAVEVDAYLREEFEKLPK